ncbi:MAG TPA: hypothetical protein VK108_01200 [Pseudogracilibacillus sp.]|nr:hypothetical protein [Pseudogracilibacillus sp.]
MELTSALLELEALKNKPRKEVMLTTASIITKRLEVKEIYPIIVGGLAVEIYTQSEYSTRNINFVAKEIEEVEKTLMELEFLKTEEQFYRKDIEMTVQIPDTKLTGSEKKVQILQIEYDTYIYVIAVEDIILDRLTSAVYEHSEQAAKWGKRMLSKNTMRIDQAYLFDHVQDDKEKQTLQSWLEKTTK